MLRYSSIGIFVAGVIIVVFGVTKILPLSTGTGIGLILLGILLFGLSFVPRPDGDYDAGEMPVFERLTKIFYAPTEVFQNLRRHPRWFTAVLIISLLSAVYSVIFFNRVGPERIVNYTIDKLADSGWVPQEQIGKMREESLKANTDPVARGGQAVSGFVSQTFLHAFLGLIFFLFALALGGKINYWQAFSASVYAFFPVAVVRYVLSSIIIFLKDPSDIHPLLGQASLLQDNLGILVTPSENPALFVLLSAFGILTFYWIWLIATGLKNTGERVSSTIGWSAAVFIFLMQIMIGVLSTLIFPNFL